MWSGKLTCIIFVAVAVSASPSAWKSGTAYRYHLSGRTLTTLLEAQDVYAGNVLRGQLELRLTSQNVLSAKLLSPKYASLRLELPGGWNSPIPENNLDFKTLPISNQPFEIKLKDGLVEGLVVNRNVPTWELNFLKAVASLLQVDTEGKNLVRDSHNARPNSTASSPNSVYRTIEDSITGKCEVLYDVSPLPPYLAAAQPNLAPLVKNFADTPIIEVVKTQNFSNCDRRVTYSFGFPGSTEAQHTDENQVGDFATRSSVSRVILSGNIGRHTLQSSSTTNKVTASPLLYNTQKAMVVGFLNLTVVSARSSSGPAPLVSNRREVNSLAYTYEPFFDYDRESPGSAQASVSASWSPSSSSEEVSSLFHASGSVSQEGSQLLPESSSGSAQESNESPNLSASAWSRNEPSEEASGGDRFKRSAYIDPERMESSYMEEPGSDRSSASAPESRETSAAPSSESSSAERKYGGSSAFQRSNPEEYKHYLPLPSLRNAPGVPMMPLFTGINGKSIAHKVNVVEAVRKIANHIGRDIADHNAMVKLNSLSKFSILTEVIRTMSAKQLQTAASNLYFRASYPNPSESESQVLRLNSWLVFRDAVAQAGTAPALMTIKDWILSHKVQGEEAAELITVLPVAAMAPTKEYLKELFKLATSSEVKKQAFLNETAILEFTNLLRLSQIDNATVHKYYPVHVYGRLVPQSDQDVQAEYIPYLERSLKEAVSRNDSVRIQVYIRAVGNIAHPRILKVFEPYLEKQRPATTFQRTLMVVSLNQLAKIYPEVARKVLYKIYQNTGEAYELRIAAVFLLFSTNPPAAMLQRMAEFTNYEANLQVNAAVITGLQSLASMKGTNYRNIVRVAKGALKFVNMTDIPLQRSSTNFRNFISEHHALAYCQTLTYMGSEDTIIPKGVYYNVTRNVGGFKHSYASLGGMVSSIDHLLQALKAHIGTEEASGESYASQPSSKWSASKIREFLNLKPSSVEPLEGNVMVKFLGMSRFLAFDEKTLEKLPAVVQEIMPAIGSERTFNFTKFFIKLPVRLAFPMATGFPFVFSLKTPTVVKVGGKASVRMQPELHLSSKSAFKLPETVNATGSLDIWIASKTEAEIGFLTPFDSRHYIAGIQKNVQLNIPAKAKIDVDVQNGSIDLQAWPLNKDKPTTMWHYSAEPFVVRHDILNLKPLQEDEDYKETKKTHYRQYESVIGEKSTGVAFSVAYDSSEKLSKKKIFQDALKDPLMLVYYPFAENQLRFENASLIYLPQRSSASSVAVSLSYASKCSGVTPAEQDPEYEPEGRSYLRKKKFARRYRLLGISELESLFNVHRESSRHQRIATFIDHVDSGAKGNPVYAIDFSTQFKGESTSAFIATAAISRSPIEENTHLIASVYRRTVVENEQPLHVFLNISSKAPVVPLTNFKEAIKSSPLFSVNASLHFGNSFAEKSVIEAQIKSNRSEERRAYVSQHPMADLCESQMSEGNNALPACRNVTAEANYMDQWEILINYDSIPVAVKNATYKSYGLLRHFALPYVDEDVFREIPTPNHVRIIPRLSPDLRELNISLESPLGSASLENVPLGPISSALLAVHPVFSAEERLSRVLLADQFNAKCAVGDSAVNTFDNNTYPIHLGKCWHVLLVLAPKYSPMGSHSSHYRLSQINDENDVAVLVRDSLSDPRKKDVKVIAGQNVVDLSPSSLGSAEEESVGPWSGTVSVNEHSLKIPSNSLTEIPEDSGDVLVQAYFVGPTAIKLRFPLHGLKMLYDGETLQMSANDSFRNSIKGLCGTFNGFPLSDYTTAHNQLLTDPQLFAAMYSLSEECQGSAPTLCRTASQKPLVSLDMVAKGFDYIDFPDILGGVPPTSNSDSSSSESEEPTDRRPTLTRPKVQSVHVLHTIVFDEGSELCFSVYPLPACTKEARPSSRIEKSIPVYCLPRQNPTAKKLKIMIDNGMNPDLRRKGATKYLKVSLPKSCVKN